MKVELMVNSECNSNCRHCYLSYSGSRSPEDTLGTIQQLQGQGHKVQIAGSETLLNPEYLKAYQQAGDKDILSNGILLHQNPSLYEKIRAHGIEEIKLSLHFGIEKDLKSVPEELVAQVLREVNKRGFTAAAAVTVTSGNYQSVDEMCEKVAEYGADNIEFIRFLPFGRGRRIAENVLTNEQVAEFFDQVVEARKKKPNLKIIPKGNFGPRKGSKGERLSAENRYCPAGIDFVAVDPQDKVYGCPFLMGPGMEIGRLEEGKIIIEKDLLGGRRDTCIANLLNDF